MVFARVEPEKCMWFEINWIEPFLVMPRHVAGHVHPPLVRQIAAVVMQLFKQIILFRHRFQFDHRHVAALGEITVLIQHIGDAAGHAGREVAAGLPRTTTTPPVMYSQPWSPTPSTTATAPELRTAKRSPATPRK
jgi:hypothetical protein